MGIFFRGYRNISNLCTHLSVENVSRYTSLVGGVSKANRGRKNMVVFCSFYVVSVFFYLVWCNFLTPIWGLVFY